MARKPSTPRPDLTTKQAHFARCVASGMTQADAYREAYSTSNMLAKTVHEKASKLMALDKVRARVDTLVAMRDKALMRSAVSTKTKVLKLLEEFALSATPQDSVKLRATELLGKSVGLFREVVEDVTGQHVSSEELRQELHTRLQTLLEEQDEPTLQ